MQQTDETVYKNRMLILFNIVLMTFMCTLDSSIVNVALPTMASKLSVNTQAISWVVSSYLIVISSLILTFGRLGDIIGKTTIFKYGIVIFTVGSLLCGITNSFTFLIIARALQAIGAAATMATNQGIITHVFPSNERGKALGISGTFVALGSMVGPSLGGIIISFTSWKYIFLINIPIGIVVFLLSIKTLPVAKRSKMEKLDLKGAILIAISITALFCSLILGEDYGYRNPFILGGLLIFFLSLIAFIAVERKTEVPLLQLKIFQNKLFSLSIFCAFTSFVAISSMIIIQPFYLQNTLGYKASVAGLILIVSPLILSVVAPISGNLSDKIGSELLTFIGLCLTSTGLFLMSSLNENSPLIAMLIYIAIMSLGNGLFQSPNNSLTMSNAPTNMLGISGSVNALIRNLGMITGTSLSVLLLYGLMSKKLGHNVSTYVVGRDDAFIYGMRGAYIAAASICAFGAILTAFRLYSSRRKKKTS